MSRVFGRGWASWTDTRLIEVLIRFLDIGPGQQSVSATLEFGSRRLGSEFSGLRFWESLLVRRCSLRELSLGGPPVAAATSVPLAPNPLSSRRGQGR